MPLTHLALLLGTSFALGADFTLLTDAAPPVVQGDVQGAVPVEQVNGRWAARLSADGWVTLPTEGRFDPRRGGLDALICPDWVAADTARHTLFHVGENDAQSHFTIFKTESAALRFVYKRDPNTYAAIDIPVYGWRQGEWHRVRASWVMVGERVLMTLQLDDGEVRYTDSARPLADLPELCYIGKRGPGSQFADAAIAHLRLTGEPIIHAPIAFGPRPPARITIDAARTLGPVRRIHDCTTPWNTRAHPLPFRVGDAKFKRFKDADFSLARLVAFSEAWLWGTKVERNEAGDIELDFSDFDDLIDTMRAGGAEPYIRLAYHMPKALSSAPDSKGWGYAPPRDLAEWDALMRAIVHHLNIERKLGVEYFVCALNESDISVAKHGADWQDILDLYDRTVRVAREVDPTIKVGGPAICHPLEGLGGKCLREFVSFCKQRGIPVDFICFHRYRCSHPSEFETHLKQIKQIVHEADPELRPEWFCDEYGLWARDHRADDEYGAAYLAAAIQYFKRGGLDKLSLVSFNDILPPPSPPSETRSLTGPFDRNEGDAARFLARDVSADGVAKRGILAHPPGPPADYVFGRYRIVVPTEGNPRLSFSTGIAISHPRMDGVGFSICVSRPGDDPLDAQVVFDHGQRQPAWENHVVPLDAFAGETVLIELRADRGRGPLASNIADHALWGEPKLVTGDPGRETTAADFVRDIATASTGTASKGWKFVYNEQIIAKTTGLPLLKGPVVTAPYFTVLLVNKLTGDEAVVELDGKQGILADDTLGVSAAVDEGAVRALLWSFNPLGEGEREVTLRFEGLDEKLDHAGKVRLRRWLIDATHTNPWHDYAIEGKPPGDSYNLTTGEPAEVRERIVDVQDGVVEVKLSVPTLAVTLIEIRPQN